MLGAKHAAQAILVTRPDCTKQFIVHELVDCGTLSQQERRFFLEYLKDTETVDPANAALRRCLNEINEGVLTQRRSETVPDQEWYESKFFNEYRRPAGVDDQLLSFVRTGQPGVYHTIGISRALGDPPFSDEDAALFELLHVSTLRRFGWQSTDGPVVSTASSALSGDNANGLAARFDGLLSPGELQVLPLLLDGLTEREIAERVGRSKHTVHDHAKSIYKALGVRSRAQLVRAALRP